MRLKQDAYTVGVVVARFQVNELTEAHKELLQSIIDSHPKVFIFLGLSPVRGSITNPLDFQPRKQMILEAFPPSEFPDITIGYIKDIPDDQLWSEILDKNIRDHMGPSDKAVLYGGRDSFLQVYKGKFPTRELVSATHVSGTEIRKRLSEKPHSHPLFRAGAIWNAFQRYPVVYSTTDFALIDAREKSNPMLLLARKTEETLWRFPGGFLEPTDGSLQSAATRELYEETLMTAAGVEYIGSFQVDDWRYRQEVDKIMTHFFMGYREMGCARASDDIAEVRWFDLSLNTEAHIVPQHIMLWQALLKKLNINLKSEMGDA